MNTSLFVSAKIRKSGVFFGGKRAFHRWKDQKYLFGEGFHRWKGLKNQFAGLMHRWKTGGKAQKN